MEVFIRERGPTADSPTKEFEVGLDNGALGVGDGSSDFMSQDDSEYRSRIIRRRMGHLVCGQPLVMIAQGWPCWLSTVLAFDLPMLAVFMPWQYREIFGMGLAGVLV